MIASTVTEVRKAVRGNLRLFRRSFRACVSSRYMSSPPFVKVIEFAETQVLEQIRGGIPYAPAFPRQGVLVPDNGGNTCKRELQVGHMYAAQIDVVRLHKAVFHENSFAVMPRLEFV